MADTPQVNISVKNNLTPQSDPGDFIAFVSGITKRGKVNDPSDVIKSWPEFVRKYGGYLEDSDFPHLVKRMLDRGTQLRINRIAHYTDITDPLTLEATKATLFIKNINITLDAAMTAGDRLSITVGGITTSWVFNGTHTQSMEALGATLVERLDSVLDWEFTPDAAGGELDLIMADDSAVSVAIYGTAPPNAVVTPANAAATFTDGSDALFTLTPISEGIDANNLSVQISDASNGEPDYFNLEIRHSKEPSLNELYQNLKIPATPTAETADFLRDIELNSNFLEVGYLDLSLLTAPLRPVDAIYTYGGAVNGGAVIAADYTGDQTVQNGVYAFDEYDDGYLLCAPEITANAVNIAHFTYCHNRKDIYAILPFADSLITSDAIIGEKDTWNLDSVYGIPVGGGLKVLNPVTQLEENIQEAADLIGCYAYTFNEFEPWFSPFGKNRGNIPNALGITNNFGSVGKFNDLNDLSRKQINMAIGRDGKLFFQNNTNGQRTNDAYQQASVAMGILFMKKTLRPILEGFLDEPADIPTFKLLYNTVKPTLDRWQVARAYTEYRWQGDQESQTTADFQINDPNDVQNGLYKIQFAIKPIGALKFIDLEITLTDAGVEFN